MFSRDCWGSSSPWTLHSFPLPALQKQPLTKIFTIYLGNYSYVSWWCAHIAIFHFSVGMIYCPLFHAYVHVCIHTHLLSFALTDYGYRVFLLGQYSLFTLQYVYTTPIWAKWGSMISLHLLKPFLLFPNLIIVFLFICLPDCFLWTYH